MSASPKLCDASPEPRKVHFVIKVSKFCNLRCRYCYEYADLDKREAMSLAQLDQMYFHIADYYRNLDFPVEIELDWQGGEALLLPSDFYWETFKRQKKIFGDLSITNAVQTNLTVLTEDRILLLKEGFDTVGVSIDLFGGLRIFKTEEDSQAKVLTNLDRLRENKIGFGCITVLTKRNIASIQKIFHFYEALKVNSFRILPLVKGAFENQHQGYELSTHEVISAFQTLFEEVLTHSSSVHIDPLNRWIDQVKHYHLTSSQPNFYHKREWENVYLVNTNGDLFSYADAYQTDWCHGNLFQSSMQDIILSNAHQKAITAAERRMAAICHSCRFFGSCDGYPVAEESVLHQPTERLDCGVEKSMLTYIEQRFQDIGIIHKSSHGSMSAYSKFNSSTLAPGVKIQFDPVGNGYESNRIQLSTGTVGATVLPIDGSQYHPGALIPAASWREPTLEEQKVLIHQDRYFSELAITVFKVPKQICASLEQKLDDFGLRDRWHPNLDLQLDIDRIKTDINQYLQNHLEYYQPDHFTLYSTPSQLQTLTKTDNQEQISAKVSYLGLHLDSWEHTSLSTSSSKSRLCLNLGKEDRHFLFINLPLNELLKAVGQTQSASASKMPRTLFSGYKFMKLYPDYPVIKLRIAPGEAYIAPTGQIIHDATSISKSYPDITLHIIGDIRGFHFQKEAILI
jgi:uncharacterized protein